MSVLSELEQGFVKKYIGDNFNPQHFVMGVLQTLFATKGTVTLSDAEDFIETQIPTLVNRLAEIIPLPFFLKSLEPEMVPVITSFVTEELDNVIESEYNALKNKVDPISPEVVKPGSNAPVAAQPAPPEVPKAETTS